MADKNEILDTDVARKNSKKAKCPDTSNPNPVKAIRLKCLDCSGGSSGEVDKCPVKQCPIWPFRYGRNPFRTRRELSDEERERLAAQLARGRKTRVEKI